MIIFRVENKLLNGPYQPTDYMGRITVEEIDGRHPSPKDIPLIAEIPRYMQRSFIQACNYKFGFKDLKTLHEWFDKETLIKLREWGFKIVRLRIDDLNIHVSTSGKQVMFKEWRRVKCLPTSKTIPSPELTPEKILPF